MVYQPSHSLQEEKLITLLIIAVPRHHSETWRCQNPCSVSTPSHKAMQRVDPLTVRCPISHQSMQPLYLTVIRHTGKSSHHSQQKTWQRDLSTFNQSLSQISANALAISPFQGRNFQSEGGKQENLLYLLQSVWGVLSGQTVWGRIGQINIVIPCCPNFYQQKYQLEIVEN